VFAAADTCRFLGVEGGRAMLETWIGVTVGAMSAIFGVLVTARDVRRREQRFQAALARPDSRFIVTIERDDGEMERHTIDPNNEADVRTLLDLMDEVDSRRRDKIAVSSHPS
jgi:hypothetical protein